LVDGDYVTLDHSRLLPDLDFDLLARFAKEPDQGTAVRGFIAEVQKRRAGG
jgi:hypothetical protein